jgi:hypothetical protein
MKKRMHSKKNQAAHGRGQLHGRSKHAGRRAKEAPPPVLAAAASLLAGGPIVSDEVMGTATDDAPEAQPKPSASPMPAPSARDHDAAPLDATPGGDGQPESSGPSTRPMRLVGIAAFAMAAIMGLALSGIRECRESVSGPDGADGFADGGSAEESSWAG